MDKQSQAGVDAAAIHGERKHEDTKHTEGASAPVATTSSSSIVIRVGN